MEGPWVRVCYTAAAYALLEVDKHETGVDCVGAESVNMNVAKGFGVHRNNLSSIFSEAVHLRIIMLESEWARGVRAGEGNAKTTGSLHIVSKCARLGRKKKSQNKSRSVTVFQGNGGPSKPRLADTRCGYTTFVLHMSTSWRKAFWENTERYINENPRWRCSTVWH
jgi:hypothetical protein